MICKKCENNIEVERLTHNIEPMPGRIHLMPAGYKFECPECRALNYLGAATKIIKCKHCKAQLSVQWLRHQIDASDIEPKTESEDTDASQAIDLNMF